MNIFHHYLKSVSSSSFRELNLAHKSLSQVFKNNTIASRKKGENHLYKILFLIGKGVPMFNVFRHIYFLGSPKAVHLFFVHFPNVLIDNGKHYVAIFVFRQKKFFVRFRHPKYYQIRFKYFSNILLLLATICLQF